MDDETIKQLAKKPVWSIIAQLNQLPDVVTAVSAYSKLVKHLYWQQKNLPALVAVGWAGIQYGLVQAETKPETAYDIKGQVKSIAYDIASFTWPGWDEPDLTIDPTARFLGLESARLNLRLAIELEKGELPTSRAHWMLGAQLLAAGEFAGARGSFEETAVLAQIAKVESEVLLAEGYVIIADGLINPAAGRASQAQLDEIKTQLAAVKDGQFFVEQLDTAWRLFAQIIK